MDSKIKIDLELRKDQAEQQLVAFEQQAAAQLQRLQGVLSRHNANPSAFTRNQVNASRLAYGRRIAGVQGAQTNLDQIKLKIDQEEVRKGGRLFGIAVNKQTEAFAKTFLGAYLAREVSNLGFAAAYQVGGSNRGLRAAQETLSAATEGAQVGSAFGPLGAAIGGVTGGLLGLAGASVKLQKEMERERLNRGIENYRYNRDTGRNIQTSMFNKLIDQTTRGGQLKMLRGRYMELAQGKGAFSLKSIDAALEKNKKDIGSDKYNRLLETREKTMGELQNLSSQLMEAAMKPTLSFMRGGDVNDSLAKQGLYAGGGSSMAKGDINIADINKSTLDEVKLIRQIAEKLAGNASNNLSGGRGLEYIVNNATPRYGN